MSVFSRGQSRVFAQSQSSVFWFSGQPLCPENIALTFSGVSFCDMCYINAPNTQSHRLSDTAPNESFTIPHVAGEIDPSDGCSWQQFIYDAANVIATHNRFNALSCGVTPDDTFELVIRPTVSTWPDGSLKTIDVNARSTSGGPPFFEIPYFKAGVSSPLLQGQYFFGDAVPNQLESSAGSGWICPLGNTNDFAIDLFFYGGAVTITEA